MVILVNDGKMYKRYDEGKIPDPKWQKRYKDTDEFGSNIVVEIQ